LNCVARNDNAENFVIPSRRRGTCLSSRYRKRARQVFLGRERVTFLCLCKEKVTKRKHTPSVAPGAARRVHGFRGVFRQDIPVLSKNARRPAARPAGLIRESRRNQGPRRSKSFRLTVKWPAWIRCDASETYAQFVCPMRSDGQLSLHVIFA